MSISYTGFLFQDIRLPVDVFSSVFLVVIVQLSLARYPEDFGEGRGFVFLTFAVFPGPNWHPPFFLGFLRLASRFLNVFFFGGVAWSPLISAY